MKLSQLTNTGLIVLDSNLNSKLDVLKHMAQLMYENGKVTSAEEFLQALLDREELSETGLENSLAIPHGKSDCVKEAALAIMTTKNVVSDWESLDESNEVKHIICLAIPKSEGGSTHLDLLATLMTKMSDEEYVDKLFSSKTPKEFYANLDYEVGASDDTDVEYDKLIVAVTACPAGIAHTYMAAEALVKAGKEMGVKVFVEKQGANGVEDKHTAENLRNADAAIFAVAVAVKNSERFDHLPITKTNVAEPLKNSKAIIENALKKAEGFSKGVANVQDEPEQEKERIFNTIKQSVLTGISYMIPLVVAGGMIGAFATLIANSFGMQELAATEGTWLWMMKQLSSGLLGTLLVPVLSAYMAYSIGDKTALVSGFAAGLVSNIIAGGFLCGMLGGLLAGFFVKYMKKYIRARGTWSGFVSFLVYPVLSTLVVGLLMFLVIGPPVAWLNQTLISFLDSLGGTNAALMGAFIGIMVSFDLGGPVNKAAYTFCVAALAEGVLIPYAVFASVKQVSGFAIAIATTVGKKYFNKEERETGKSAGVLVLGGITEGAIPFMMADPLRVIIALCTGSAITGAIVAVANIGLDVPGAGIISMFMLKSPMDPFAAAAIWLGAAVVGAIISGILLIVLRKAKLKKKGLTEIVEV